jgi:hypothetical protein
MSSLLAPNRASGQLQSGDTCYPPLADPQPLAAWMLRGLPGHQALHLPVRVDGAV